MSTSEPGGPSSRSTLPTARPEPVDLEVDDAGVHAFGFPSPALSLSERRDFAVGNSFFRKNWTTEPSSAPGRDGLGPLFNARSCSGCHLRDGRSRPPTPEDTASDGLLLRLGLPRPHGPDLPDPIYGGQLQDQAILGLAPEGRVVIRTQRRAGTYGDGASFELLAPEYAIGDPAYGPPAAGLALSPRTAPHLIGLGLLESVPEADLRSAADPDDRNGDGISGRPNTLRLPDGRTVLGRFGWKAAQPDVARQTAAAFADDIGITSLEFPLDPRPPSLPAAQSAPDIDAHKLARTVFYTRMLAVPRRRDMEAPVVRRGEALFTSIGCADCHTPAWRTGDEVPHPAFRRREIRPYTDLLLHDMGPGLADGKRDGDAGPTEWRTPPLWGIGLFPAVSGHSRYLHDGRARDLAEAVLWHGGEAEGARERFRLAVPEDRAALLAFLGSL